MPSEHDRSVSATRAHTQERVPGKFHCLGKENNVKAQVKQGQQSVWPETFQY